MEESRKNVLLEKLADWQKAKDFAKETAKQTGKEAINPKELGKALRSALGKGAVLGGSVLAAKYLKKKPTMMQKLIGKDTPGRKALMFGAGAAGIAGGLKGVEALGEKIGDPLKKKKYFNNMIEENPALRKESPRDVSRIFRTLYKFNPTMASDPLVAGSFLKRSLQYKDEGIQPMDIKTLVEVGKNLKDSKKKDSLLRNAFVGSGAELLSYAG